MNEGTRASVLDRARQSLGISADVIYRLVADALGERHVRGRIADVGAGEGRFLGAARHLCTSYVAVDLLRHPALASDAEFVAADLDRGPIPLPDSSVDAAVAIEIIEHLENARAFVRELVRIVRPGGWVVITTPNQLSVLSLLSLIVKGQFAAFQDGNYPAHRTALLESDLRRIAAECGLDSTDVRYTAHGRVPLTAWHFPPTLSRLAPRAFSDNVALLGRKGA